MSKTNKMGLVAVLVGLLSGPSNLFAAASGNYTDLLPIGAAANTTVISNGTGWSLTTLPPTQTFGDGLSRVVTTVFQSTGTATINATTTVSTFSALSGLGSVGSTTFPQSWVAQGRSIRVTTQGTYSSANSGSTWTWAIKLGTTTILTTGAVNFVPSQTDRFFKATGLVTLSGTGNAATALGSYDIMVASGTTQPSSYVSYSTQTISGAITVDLTSQLTVNPTLTWGAATSSMTIRNVTVEFLN